MRACVHACQRVLPKYVKIEKWVKAYNLGKYSAAADYNMSRGVASFALADTCVQAETKQSVYTDTHKHTRTSPCHAMPCHADWCSKQAPARVRPSPLLP